MKNVLMAVVLTVVLLTGVITMMDIVPVAWADGSGD